MLNQVTLIGRITKDVELRQTQSGISCVSFTLAVDRGFKDQNGNRQADFINCVAWRQAADYMAQYVGKGFMLAVTGSIQTRSYQDQNNKTIFVTEVMCDRVVNLQPKETANDPQPQTSEDLDLPF